MGCLLWKWQYVYIIHWSSLYHVVDHVKLNVPVYYVIHYNQWFLLLSVASALLI